ncbi:serine/threonine protein kinase [Blastomyces percursus]|uniref:Serine/threonine protein kinase n=1 Tax=Blastomyces percursus TaxID=1658174 RepID=A0A1J9PDX8_9EURO|nr:serine/threonine protein kinase [Blastomyces percursus]
MVFSNTMATATTPQHAKGDDAADFGDFVSTEEEEEDLEDVVEPWHKYDPKETPHVLYPVRLGEVLNKRYLIEHKLGSGGFSTVWMARDLQDKRDVALKIMAAGPWGENELRMQNEILRTTKDTSRLVTYLATFLLPGNNQHRVLVYPLRGPCLSYSTIKGASMVTRMSAAKQLLEALKILHGAGIVHRDLNERNCMWGMVPLHNLSRSAKYEALGRPIKQVIPNVRLWKQGELVGPVEIPQDLRTDEFYLGDFGLAMKLGDPVTEHGHPPMVFCSPDRLHRKGPSFACDMWSYMVLFAELYLGHPPFADWFDGGILTGIVRCLGPLPEQWKGDYADPNGGLDSWYDQSTKADPDSSIAGTIAHFRPDSDAIERKHMYSLLSKGFNYCPEKRLTAEQLLQDPTFRAIMKKYGC